MDKSWWRQYIDDVRNSNAQLMCCDRVGIPGVQYKDIVKFGNSGATAIALAKRLGYEKIYLYGYDCQYTGGKRHWHDDHPQGLGNADSMPQWRRQFDRLEKHVTGLNIINVSRVSSLTHWPKMELDDIC